MSLKVLPILRMILPLGDAQQIQRSLGNPALAGPKSSLYVGRRSQSLLSNGIISLRISSGKRLITTRFRYSRISLALYPPTFVFSRLLVHGKMNFIRVAERVIRTEQHSTFFAANRSSRDIFLICKLKRKLVVEIKRNEIRILIYDRNAFAEVDY